eukprot:CAMPEP_0194289344 /NCGR_PEP_ID=MMETSP0169-20130528/38895_1 /TAXON_ID=218684 /ORGANISM="Corethron pennatum, Strain L29A3" /LENGTH=252 /DNA_ID=CAMNT_0039036599 /DNA_START=404 /DNA_END=1162 /DNA_ORIENTATION=-
MQRLAGSVETVGSILRGTVFTGVLYGGEVPPKQLQLHFRRVALHIAFPLSCISPDWFLSQIFDVRIHPVAEVVVHPTRRLSHNAPERFPESYPILLHGKGNHLNLNPERVLVPLDVLPEAPVPPDPRKLSARPCESPRRHHTGRGTNARSFLRVAIRAPYAFRRCILKRPRDGLRGIGVRPQPRVVFQFQCVSEIHKVVLEFPPARRLLHGISRARDEDRWVSAPVSRRYQVRSRRRGQVLGAPVEGEELFS